MDNNHLLMLGEIKGKLDGIEKKLDTHGKVTNSIDGRLRKVEQRSAVIGATSGGIMGLGVALIIQAIKQKTGFGGS